MRKLIATFALVAVASGAVVAVGHADHDGGHRSSTFFDIGKRFGRELGKVFGIDFGGTADEAGGGGGGANAGADDSATIPAALDLSCSGGSTYAWTLTEGATTGSTCAVSNHTANQWDCTDGSSCIIASPTSATTTATCSMGDEDGVGAATYEFTCTVDGGASSDTMIGSVTCTTPQPGYPQLCREFAVAELDTICDGVTGDPACGTSGVPTFTTPPDCSLLTTVSGTAADTEAEVESAFSTGGRNIILASGGDLSSSTTLNLTGDNNCVQFNGVDIGQIELGTAGGADATNSLFVGATGSCLGGVSNSFPGSTSALSLAQNITFDGFAIGECNSISSGPLFNFPTGGTSGEYVGAQTIAVVNSVMLANTASGEAAAGFLSSGSDWVIANVNIVTGTGCTYPGTDPDSWGYRQAGGGPSGIANRHFRADVMIDARACRQDQRHGGYWNWSINYSTAGHRQDGLTSLIPNDKRRTLFYQPNRPHPMASIAVGSGIAVGTGAISAYIQNFTGNAQTSTTVFGPATGSGTAGDDFLWLFIGVDWYGESDQTTTWTQTLFETTLPAQSYHDGDEVWDMHDPDANEPGEYSNTSTDITTVISIRDSFPDVYGGLTVGANYLVGADPLDCDSAGDCVP